MAITKLLLQAIHGTVIRPLTILNHNNVFKKYSHVVCLCFILHCKFVPVSINKTQPNHPMNGQDNQCIPNMAILQS